MRSEGIAQPGDRRFDLGVGLTGEEILALWCRGDHRHDVLDIAPHEHRPRDRVERDIAKATCCHDRPESVAVGERERARSAWLANIGRPPEMG